MLQERVVKGVSGWLMVAVLFGGIAAAIILLVQSETVHDSPGSVALVIVGIALLASGFLGLTVVPPNTARVILLFGNYKGSIKTPGFWWLNPLTTRRRVSLKVRNFESGHLKVNDHIGNPIEIAAIVVWRVVETAEAVFQMDDYEHFVHVQTESAVRILATSFPYDAHEEGELSLRGSAAEVSQRLKQEIQDRLASAGVEVIEARISHLAYAPEIANAMLRRQQATAIIAARQKIVEGAVGMVEMALDLLSAKRVVELDEERKATMVSNLLVVLCSDRDAQPVVNAGTLYISDRRGSHAMAERKTFLVRLDPAVHEALQRWADSDLRSLNAQIEFLLRRTLRDAGRLPAMLDDARAVRSKKRE